MRVSRKGLLGGLAASLVLAGLWSAFTFRSNDSYADQGGRTMKVVRIYTGPDNKSHFEDLEIPLRDGGKVGFVSELSKEVPYWSRRHLVKPGITGWAQVCRGYAADVESAADKLSYDLYYLKHRALALDLAIAAKTARVVLSGFGSR